MKFLSDKILVRNYVTEILGKEYLAPLIGVYDKSDQIQIHSLPDQFIIKTNHGSGWNIICLHKLNFSWVDEKRKLDYWLKLNYYWIWREWNYMDIQPKILIEKLMVDEKGAIPNDYKIHCFQGKAKMVEVHIDRFSNHKIIYMDLDWNILPFHKSFKAYNKRPARPKQLEKIINLAEKAAGDLPFVRVDFYFIGEQAYITEMTFFPGSGFSKFHPPEWDHIIGDWFDISDFYSVKY
jgi:hypothetical protein